jgi:hypothetical protein
MLGAPDSASHEPVFGQSPRRPSFQLNLFVKKGQQRPAHINGLGASIRGCRCCRPDLALVSFYSLTFAFLTIFLGSCILFADMRLPLELLFLAQLVCARVIINQNILTEEQERPAYGIGIHFATSYATAAVRYENGTLWDLARVSF